MGLFRPFAQQPARIPRIDDFFHPERFGGAQRRTELIERGLDFAPPRIRIWGRFDIPFIRRLHTALDRQRSPIA